MQRSDSQIGHLVGDVPLLVAGRAGGIRAVHGQRADGKRVAAHREDRPDHVADELRRRVGHERQADALAGRLRRHADLVQVRQGAVDRRKFFWTIALPFLAYVFSVAALIASIALSLGITPDSAKKHVCRIVFTRDPRPSPDATFDASMTWSLRCLSMICCCTSRGISSQTSSDEYGLLMSTVAPGAAAASVSSL